MIDSWYKAMEGTWSEEVQEYVQHFNIAKRRMHF